MEINEQSRINKQYNLLKEEIKNEIHKDGPISILKLLEMINNEELVIPDFQRDFVWNLDRFTLLFDSIYRNYTIGGLLLWKTDNKLAHRKIGAKECIKVNNIKEKKEYTYVLDGQQRLTTIHAILNNKAIYKSGLKNLKKFKIYFDIEQDQFRKGTERLENGKRLEKVITNGGFSKFKFIDMSQIFDKNLNFPDNLIEPEKNKLYQDDNLSKDKLILEIKKIDKIKLELEHFKELFESYKIFQYVDRNPNIEKIVTIFERINTQNMKLDIFDIMVAKTYQNIQYNNENITFNLKNAKNKILYKYELTKEQYNPNDNTLTDDNNLYYSISGTTILRMITIFINVKNENSNKIALLKQDIYNLTAIEIQESLKEIRNLIIDLNNYLFHQINIKEINENIINNNILSFLTYIFSKKRYKNNDLILINKWLWNTLLFNRYSGSQLQQIESDVLKFNNSIESFKLRIKEKRNLNLFNMEFEFNNQKLLKAGYDKTNFLYQATILLLNSLKPKDFNGKQEINISNYIGSNTKNNKHHIIPYKSKDGIKLRQLPNGEKIINNIANISIISSELNKEISNLNPVDYFKKYKDKNDFYEILETHLISKDMYEDLINKEYDSFLIKRTNKIIEKIKELCSIDNENIQIYDEEE